MNTASELGPHTQTDRGTCPGDCRALSLLQKPLKTRTNTNPTGTVANAADRSVRACVARESIRQES
jgi:hypothetical protein